MIRPLSSSPTSLSPALPFRCVSVRERGGGEGERKRERGERERVGEGGQCGAGEL